MALFPMKRSIESGGESPNYVTNTYIDAGSTGSSYVKTIRSVNNLEYANLKVGSTIIISGNGHNDRSWCNLVLNDGTSASSKIDIQFNTSAFQVITASASQVVLKVLDDSETVSVVVWRGHDELPNRSVVTITVLS